MIKKSVMAGNAPNPEFKTSVLAIWGKLMIYTTNYITIKITLSYANIWPQKHYRNYIKGGIFCSCFQIILSLYYSSDKELIKDMRYFWRHRVRHLSSWKETHLTRSPKSKLGKEEVIPPLLSQCLSPPQATSAICSPTSSHKFNHTKVLSFCILFSS